MPSTKVGELVLKAKGDRSYRVYQEESGVDAAIIHRIVNGTYIPKSLDIYKKLSAGEPNGVTFDEMVSAANFSSEYQKGMKDGFEMSESSHSISELLSYSLIEGTSALIKEIAKARSSSTKEKKDKAKKVDKVEKKLDNIKRYCAIADGILFSSFAKSGIVFKQITSKKGRLFECETDTYLQIEEQLYSSYLVRHLYFEESDEKIGWLIRDASERLIGELLFSESSSERKVSVITSSKKSI